MARPLDMRRRSAAVRRSRLGASAGHRFSRGQRQRRYRNFIKMPGSVRGRGRSWQLAACSRRNYLKARPALAEMRGFRPWNPGQNASTGRPTIP